MSPSVRTCSAYRSPVRTRGERRRVEDSPRELESLDHGFEIVRIVEEARVDQRRRGGIGALQCDETPALRAKQTDVARKPVADVPGAGVIVGERDDQLHLHVGSRQIRVGLQERAAFGEIRRHHAAPLATIAAEFFDEPHDARPGESEKVALI